MNTALLHLSLLPGIGPRVVEQLAKVVPYAQFDQLYAWSQHDFMYRADLSERYADVLVKGLADSSCLHKELKLIQVHGIKWVTIADASYPALLKETHLPPTVLYWQGALEPFSQRGVAIVGSRKANAYGYSVIEALVPGLVAAGLPIISGGALGADTMAHRRALVAGGLTCAVIGAGLLKPYPASNRELFESIIASGGAVVSPFPLEMGALPGNFPARNRIISGMSQATVVVQAAEKSGARITALYALEQGREVCAVPGSIEDPLSAGCHKLLTEGASLVASAQDILEVCGYSLPGASIPISQDAGSQLSTIAKTAPTSIELHQTLTDQDPIIAACRVPQTFDDLLENLEYDFAHLQERLLDLQLKGALEQDFMGRWCGIR